MLSPDDSRLEAPRIHATLVSRHLIEPSEYLPEGVIRFEDLRLDNEGVRANQLESANVVDPDQDRDPQRDVDPPRVYGSLERLDNMLSGRRPVQLVLGERLTRSVFEDTDAFLRRVHEPPIPQPEPGKCNAYHEWVCNFVDACDDGTPFKEKMPGKKEEVAAAAPVAAAMEQADATVEMEEAPAAQNSHAKPPRCFFCPISHQALRDPVVASDGNTYERNFLSIQFSRNDYKSPLTREPLQPVFFPNRAIVEAMHHWAMTQKPPMDVD
jgi:hypothetical protein